MGWRVNATAGVPAHNSMVYVLSHTSYADFFIFLLYRGAHPELRGIRSLVRPQSFVMWGWLLRSFGCMPSTPVEHTGGGAVDRVVENLRMDLAKSGRAGLALSPGGARERRPWKSGYYHIARAMGAPIASIGCDYEKHCLTVCPEIVNTDDRTAVEAHLRGGLSEIIPLYPECEVVDSWRPYNPAHVRILGWASPR